jgi:hypothetical protein
MAIYRQINCENGVRDPKLVQWTSYWNDSALKLDGPFIHDRWVYMDTTNPKLLKIGLMYL